MTQTNDSKKRCQFQTSIKNGISNQTKRYETKRNETKMINVLIVARTKVKWQKLMGKLEDEK